MPAGSRKSALPRWDIQSIYPSLNAAEYVRDKKLLKTEIHTPEKLLSGVSADQSGGLAAEKTGGTGPKAPEDFLLSYLKGYQKAADLHESLSSYAYMMYSTDTHNAEALREINVLETLVLPLRRVEVGFRNVLAAFGRDAGDLASASKELKEYKFFLREELLLQKKQMAPDLEDLASDLSRSGADSWERLHQAVSANTSVQWGKGKRKTAVELRSLAHDPDRKIREKAYRLELEAWKSVETPLAYALNGVKGFSVSLNLRRHYRTTLEKSVLQSRMSPKSLDALISAMKNSLPLFRRYLKAKARVLGLSQLAFFDLFAPLSAGSKKWTYEEASGFIIEKFYRFSADLGRFAAHAFEAGWIDAEPRKGKVGGAYCISVPRTRESRVLCNFDGSFSSVTTIAHELGHAYHHEVLKDAGAIHRAYPMTLAETASIFSETLIFADSIKEAKAEDKIPVIESFLQDSTQVIVDILSRFIFENALFKKRAEAEISADEFGEMMLAAQKETYGDALDEKFLHPYMWAVKGHYYSQDLGYYNFPYAFGLLFGLGLYARYTAEGPDFAGTYRRILAETGRDSAVAVARKAGFHIESEDFWQSGIAAIEVYIQQFEELTQ